MNILSRERLKLIVNRVDKKTKDEIGISFSEIVKAQPSILNKMTPSSIIEGVKENNLNDIQSFMNLIYDFHQKNIYKKDNLNKDQKSINNNQNIVNYVSRHCIKYAENFMGFDVLSPEDKPTIDMIEKMKRDNRIRFTLYQVNELNGSRMSLVIPSSKMIEDHVLDKNNWSHMAYASRHKHGYSLLTVSFPIVEDKKSGLNDYYKKNARPVFSHAEVRSDNIGCKPDGRFYIKNPSEPILTHTQAIDNDFAGPLMSIDIKHGWYLDNNFETSNIKIADIVEELNNKQRKRNENNKDEQEITNSSSFNGPGFG